jgi:hypothetical protein
LSGFFSVILLGLPTLGAGKRSWAFGFPDQEYILTDNQEPGGLTHRAEEYLQIFKKGAEFTRELLKENERLRFRTLELEQQLSAGVQMAEVQLLRERLCRAEAEKEEILARIRSIEMENLDFSKRYTEIEGENNLLANLYITIFQLYSTFDLQEVFRVIEEILLNLVGVEEFTLVLLNADGSMFQPVLSASDDYRLQSVVVDDARIIEAMATGVSWIGHSEGGAAFPASGPLAVIPLQVDQEGIGGLVVRRLLAQKQNFTDMDREIFSLLSRHAAMAICIALLRQGEKGRIDFNSGLLV